MFKIFKKKEEVPTPADAIQNLRGTEDMLLKKQDFLEKKIESEVEIARKNAKTNKRAALVALKRKKRFEKQLQQIDGTLTTIEQQREALESANINTTVLKTMTSGAKALKKAHNDMDVDKVHDMLDEIADQQEVANQIGDAISNPVAFGQEFDEDELEAELDALGSEIDADEQAQLEKELLDIVPSKLPDVPTAEPKSKSGSKQTADKKSKKAQEEDEMAELAAWAS